MTMVMILKKEKIMLRGVNRRVIEINGNKDDFFEKAVFFIKYNYDNQQDPSLAFSARDFITDMQSFQRPHSLFQKPKRKSAMLVKISFCVTLSLFFLAGGMLLVKMLL